VSLIIPCAFVITSLFLRDLHLATASLVAGSLISLLPLILLRVQTGQEFLLRALLSSQFLGIFLLSLGVMSLGYSSDYALSLILCSLLLRISLSLATRPFLALISLLSMQNRFAFYFSNMVFAIFIAKEFSDSLLLLFGATAALSVLAFLLPRHTQMFGFMQRALNKISRVSHRIVGPIVIEWLVFRLLGTFTVGSRLTMRLFSYTSLQRHFATGLLLLLVLFVFILRL
jgi:hypothetical protein